MDDADLQRFGRPRRRVSFPEGVVRASAVQVVASNGTVHDVETVRVTEQGVWTRSASQVSFWPWGSVLRVIFQDGDLPRRGRHATE